jgi:putative endonuclease
MTPSITVYVLQSMSSGNHYVGISNDLDRRMSEHNRNTSRSTCHRGPWKLLYSEKCADYSEARKRERFLKSGPGHEFLRKAGVA